jgi:hypothetical protein
MSNNIETNPVQLFLSVYFQSTFDNIESINRYLLEHKSVSELLEADQENTASPQQAMFLFFDAATEEICSSLKLDICLPDNALIKHIDNKIVTTELGNEAGVPSVPNALEKVESYAALCHIAEQHQLGNKLVVQTAYGDSGKTTFFISNEADFEQVAEQIIAEDKVKIMKHIRCVGTAIEGAATRAGTFVGPLLSELIGFETLTPYQGGWCGNELYEDCFSAEIRQTASQLTEKLGNTLYKRGYRGYFEVDYLIDLDDHQIYLGELNPRITGISAMTNTSPFCTQHLPLFLFHLLEYTDIALDIDPITFNTLCLAEGATGISGQLIIKYTQTDTQIMTQAPVSGVYRLNNGQLELIKTSANRQDARAIHEAYLMRIMNTDEHSYQGADLAILFVNQQLTTPQHALTTAANDWIAAVQTAFEWRELTQEEEELAGRFKNPVGLLKGFSDNGPEET